MKVGVLYFPGTNCDSDLIAVLTSEYQFQCEKLWHTDSFEPDHDLYFVPGGFSYGDYLRSGAMASIAKSMYSLQQAASQGRTIVGICNGFQILTEAHLLPGALIKNSTLKHICNWVELNCQMEFENIKNFTLPISHSEGNYICSDDDYKQLEDNKQILFSYKNNPNGSRSDIAGICSENRKVIGLMPHPERAVYQNIDVKSSSSQPGKLFFDTLFTLL